MGWGPHRHIASSSASLPRPRVHSHKGRPVAATPEAPEGAGPERDTGFSKCWRSVSAKLGLDSPLCFWLLVAGLGPRGL